MMRNNNLHYASPSHHYAGLDSDRMAMALNFTPNINLFSFKVGAAYHF